MSKYLVCVPITEYHNARFVVEADSEEAAEDAAYDQARHNREPVLDDCVDWIIDGDPWVVTEIDE